MFAYVKIKKIAGECARLFAWTLQCSKFFQASEPIQDTYIRPSRLHINDVGIFHAFLKRYKCLKLAPAVKVQHLTVCK